MCGAQAPLSKISVEGSQNMPYLYGFGGFTLIILDILSINLSNMVDGLEFVVL
jgi:hypothetical protein